MAKSKKQVELEQQVEDLTADLQRTRADFENFRKRSDVEKASARTAGQSSAVTKLLPVIDNIDRAVTHMPDDLKDNSWAQAVAALPKNLQKSLESLSVERINATKGTIFDPNMHEAIQFDEDAQGESEVVDEELQAGYLLDGQPIRHAMVKVTRQ